MIGIRIGNRDIDNLRTVRDEPLQKWWGRGYFSTFSCRRFYLGFKSRRGCTNFFLVRDILLTQSQSWHSPSSKKYFFFIFHKVVLLHTVKTLLQRKHSQVSDTLKAAIAQSWGYVNFFVIKFILACSKGWILWVAWVDFQPFWESGCLENLAKLKSFLCFLQDF